MASKSTSRTGFATHREMGLYVHVVESIGLGVYVYVMGKREKKGEKGKERSKGWKDKEEQGREEGRKEGSCKTSR